MGNMTIIVALLAVMIIAYQVGLLRTKQVATANANVRMHSRPTHYAFVVALTTVIPAVIVLLAFYFIAPIVTENLLASYLAHVDTGSIDTASTIKKITQMESNFLTTQGAAAWELTAVEYLKAINSRKNWLLIALLSTVVAAALTYSLRKIKATFRARHVVEKSVKSLLVICSIVAILTTLGIVLSMVGETLKFFGFVSPSDFFFGTTWNPRFSSTGSGEQGSFGLLPLLSGTMLIALIALLVAIPLGLMVAIYLSEYASRQFRNTAKPIIEVLAGIPTIVYGFFALVTFGPWLRDFGDLVGLDIRATSALSAGIVMGIMIIPFISSLADDIITQVPKTLRDASLGLGATKSETIRKVVLTAALPGIVGAVLLAASRAIGETMIVVMAAGNSPTLTANPFEAVSTVTVTIVNQLTGDNDFASPQSLVAFALGLTLFVITLLLNVVALAIVRKYREQYD